MKDLYNEILELDKLNTTGSYSTHLSKLTEEIGELASEANKLSGLKRNKKNETIDEIKYNLASEAADSIQNIMAICGRADVPYEILVECLTKSNKEWKDKYLTPNE